MPTEPLETEDQAVSASDLKGPRSEFGSYTSAAQIGRGESKRSMYKAWNEVHECWVALRVI